MKKEWNMPTLEILDINQTMTGSSGTAQDGIIYERNGDESFITHGPHSGYTVRII